MEKLVQEKKEIVFFIFLYPLPFHKDALWKSKTIQCRKSLPLLVEAFAHREIPKPDCDTQEIEENIKLAEALDITETPTVVLPSGKVHGGTLATDQLFKFVQGG